MKKLKTNRIISLMLLFVLSLCLVSCGKKSTKPNDAGSENSASTAESKSGDAEDDPAKVYAVFTSTNSWEDSGNKYVQYDMTLFNDGSEKINDWALEAACPTDMAVFQNWNIDISKNEQSLTIKPIDYAKNIDVGGKTEGLGFIVYDSAGTQFSDYVISYITDSGTHQISGIIGENNSSENTAQNDNNSNEGTADAKEDSSNMNKVVVSDAKVANTISALHVDGISLRNEKNEAVRLQGISTLGLAWYPQYVNEDTFRSFRDDWGINTIRLAMYTQEDGGYCVSDDTKKQELKDLIDQGVKAAADLNLYVIIDWHILSDGNPLMHESEAEAFFDEMSRKYSSYKNVLYEICNEPNNSSWSGQIKPYAEKIIPIIRANSPDSVIIVGTNTWSQDVDDVISDPINGYNIMYTLHFYAATHKDDIRDKARMALAAGVPIFITECSICDASGNGGLDLDSANEWKTFINETGLSFIEWSLSNKDESSAILKPDCTKLSDFTESDYTDSAKFYREWMRENAGIE